MVADARAGRSPPIDWQSLPPAEQFMVLRLDAGELFEQQLAARLGAARARELREANDGWTANRGMVGSDGRCNESCDPCGYGVKMPGSGLPMSAIV